MNGTSFGLFLFNSFLIQFYQLLINKQLVMEELPLLGEYKKLLEEQVKFQEL